MGRVGGLMTAYGPTVGGALALGSQGAAVPRRQRVRVLAPTRHQRATRSRGVEAARSPFLARVRGSEVHVVCARSTRVTRERQ